MRAIGKYIVIEPIKEETKASSGLIMTSTDENDLRYGKAECIHVGEDVIAAISSPQLSFITTEELVMALEFRIVRII
jgi:co-chaperonin GroES (HSP10)